LKNPVDVFALAETLSEPKERYFEFEKS